MDSDADSEEADLEAADWGLEEVAWDSEVVAWDSEVVETEEETVVNAAEVEDSAAVGEVGETTRSNSNSWHKNQGTLVPGSVQVHIVRSGSVDRTATSTRRLRLSPPRRLGSSSSWWTRGLATRHGSTRRTSSLHRPGWRTSTRPSTGSGSSPRAMKGTSKSKRTPPVRFFVS